MNCQCNPLCCCWQAATFLSHILALRQGKTENVTSNYKILQAIILYWSLSIYLHLLTGFQLLLGDASCHAAQDGKISMHTDLDLRPPFPIRHTASENIGKFRIALVLRHGKTNGWSTKLHPEAQPNTCEHQILSVAGITNTIILMYHLENHSQHRPFGMKLS